MPAHSRWKNGVASLAYVAGIHVFLLNAKKDVDGRNKSGHDVRVRYDYRASRPLVLAPKTLRSKPLSTWRSATRQISCFTG
jgi:hypothetical protein